MIDVKQCGLRALEKNRTSFSRRDIEVVRSVGNEWCKTLSQNRHLFEDFTGIQTLTAVRFDNAIRIFEVSLDTRTEHVGHECVRGADSTTSGLVFVSRADAAQRSTDFFVAEPLFAGMVQSAVIRKDQMRPRADLHSL